MTRVRRRCRAPTPSPAPAPAGEGPLVTIDALGRKCPIPIIMLAQRINEVPIGSIIAVLADDPAAETDVPAWCLISPTTTCSPSRSSAAGRS